jgi:hypothetical protein
MQVATVSTEKPSMRDQIHGWTFEDASLFVRKAARGWPARVFIGHTPAPKSIPTYETILEMLAEGWRLLAPPVLCSTPRTDGSAPYVCYEWWLTRDRQEGTSAP